MIPLRALAGQSFVVMGLGKSGTGAVHALSAAGVQVRAWDDKPEARAGVPDALLAAPGAVDWRGVSALIWSPGIPHTLPRPHPMEGGAACAAGGNQIGRAHV